MQSERLLTSKQTVRKVADIYTNIQKDYRLLYKQSETLDFYTNSQKGNRGLYKQSERLHTSIKTVRKVTDFYTNSQKG